MRTLIKADWVVTPDGRELKNGVVVVEKGKVKEYLPEEPEGDFKLFRVKGVLYPPFVNCHTHLELSWMEFDPDRFKDFFQWLLWIIGSRSTKTLEELKAAVKKGVRLLKESGTYYAGDISSFGVSPNLKFEGVELLCYREFIGKELNPKELPPPLSIHSVYSVSFEAIKAIAADSLERNYKFQIHLAETAQEQAFVKCQKNAFEELIYPVLGRKRYEKVCAEGVVDYLKRAGALNRNAIAVHCVNLTEKEIEELQRAEVSVVFCPRSNLHLKVGFPRVEKFLDYPFVGLGTDGLSTNADLSVVEELKTLYYRLNCQVPVKKLFPLITYKGAKVLGISDYGEKAVFTVAEGVFSSPYQPILKSRQKFAVLDFSNTL